MLQPLMQKLIYTRRVTLVKQDLFILPENMRSLSVFSEISVKYLVFCVVILFITVFLFMLAVVLSVPFSVGRYIVCPFFCWPLYCLSFHLRLLITPFSIFNLFIDL